MYHYGKEALLLDVSETTAFVTYRTPVNKTRTSPDLSRLADIRHNLLISAPEDVSLEDVLNELRTIKEKYVNLPMILDYICEQDDA